MLCAATVPALAQDGDDDDDNSASELQYGDDVDIGDINAQVCRNIIGDLNVTANQYNSGDQIAIGDGNIQAIAQEQNVAVNVVQNCINLINSSLNDDDGNGGGTDKGDDDDNVVDDRYDEDDDDNGDRGEGEEKKTLTVGGDQIVAASVPDKPLAATGGFAPSASSMLLPAGALLVVSGAMAFWLGIRRR